MIVFFKHLQFSILLLFVILILTLIPSSEVPNSSGLELDKVIHFILFLSFSFSLVIGLLKQYYIKIMNRYALQFSVIISLFFSILTEVLQYFMHVGRIFDWSDIFANICGVLVAIITFLLIKGKDDLCIN